MNRRVPLLMLGLVVIVSAISFLIFYIEESIFFLFVTIFLLVAGTVSIVIVQAIDLAKHEKMIDYEMVEKYHLHLVDCPACEKENILEDQYCRFCGEQLKGEKDV